MKANTALLQNLTLRPARGLDHSFDGSSLLKPEDQDHNNTLDSSLASSYGTMRSQYTSYVLSKFNDNKQLVNELKKQAESQVKALLLALVAAFLVSLGTLRDSF